MVKRKKAPANQDDAARERHKKGSEEDRWDLEDDPFRDLRPSDDDMRNQPTDEYMWPDMTDEYEDDD